MEEPIALLNYGTASINPALWDSVVSQRRLHSLRTHSLARGHKANRWETISGQWSLEKYAEVTTQAAAVGMDEMYFSKSFLDRAGAGDGDGEWG